MFSKTVEYALRAVAHLAYEAPNARTTEQIAAATKVKTAYLSKVLQGLNRAGILRSQRGIGGGIALVKRPDELTILEVVNAVEPIQRIKTCPLGLKGHGAAPVPAAPADGRRDGDGREGVRRDDAGRGAGRADGQSRRCARLASAGSARKRIDCPPIPRSPSVRGCRPGLS